MLATPAGPGPMTHVGRQPIFDRAGDVVAYELLFRDTAEAVTASRSSAQATSRVIVSAFTEFGLDQLVGGRQCFLNVTREFLVGELPVPFEPNQIVLEIIETVPVDTRAIDGVTELRERGFGIALDDFEWGQGAERLIEQATYVKIDMLDCDLGELRESVRRCRRYPHLRLIAERLESEEHLQTAVDLGFDLFQGHVLGRPHVISRVSMSPARVSRLALITALSESPIDFDRVISLITRDPTLSYRLLHASHSTAAGLSTRVGSVRQAAQLLGPELVRQWVVLMLFSDLTDATEEQLTASTTRARFCELLAGRLGLPTDAAFTVGLLSSVAELIAQPSAEIVSDLSLSEDVQAALATGDGQLGRLLDAVVGYEHGKVAAAAGLLGVDPAEPEPLLAAYRSAMGWSAELAEEPPEP